MESEDENLKEYILISGASSGIGRTLAIRLSEQHNVILHGRNLERIEETKRACSKETSHLIFQFDLQHYDKVEKELSDFVIQNKINIKHFVHCAGTLKMLPLKLFTSEMMNSIFSVNVFSAALITKVLVNKRINKTLKGIVFISSNISNFGAKAFSIYGSSKGALDSLMRSLAVELAPFVRVNSVLPGSIQTEMTEKILDNAELYERLIKTYPLGIGYPDDIYEAVAFLISDKSRWITGLQLTVDGGRTINISG